MVNWTWIALGILSAASGGWAGSAHEQTSGEIAVSGQFDPAIDSKALSATSTDEFVWIRGPDNVHCGCDGPPVRYRPLFEYGVVEDYELYWEYNPDGMGWEFGAYYYEHSHGRFELVLSSSWSYVDVRVTATYIPTGAWGTYPHRTNIYP